MRLDEVIRTYITPIKRFDYTLGPNYTAQDIYNYYKQQVRDGEVNGRLT